MKCTALALALFLGGASAFAPSSRALPAVRSSVQQNVLPPAVFEEAMTTFKTDYPGFAAKGWGPSAKAERWNGRHAMFGWFFIICTGYAQAHNLIPDAATALDVNVWGGLSRVSGAEAISNERAIILIANIHAFMVGLCATFAPLGYMDTLLIEEGDADEPAAGTFPAFETGLTPAAEMWNGRMAMMGLVTATSYSLMTGTPFMDTVNLWLGGLLIPN